MQLQRRIVPKGGLDVLEAGSCGLRRQVKGATADKRKHVWLPVGVQVQGVDLHQPALAITAAVTSTTPARQLKIRTHHHYDTSRGDDMHDVGCAPLDSEVIGMNRLWPLGQVPDRQLAVRPVFVDRRLHHPVLEKHACPSGRNNNIPVKFNAGVLQGDILAGDLVPDQQRPAGSEQPRRQQCGDDGTPPSQGFIAAVQRNLIAVNYRISPSRK